MLLSPPLLDEVIAGTIRTLFLTGFLLLVVTLLQASFWEGYPLKQLGVRASAGRGLLDYLYYSLKDDVGVWGYDPIQGALAPVLCVSCHLSLFILLWSGLLYGYDSFRTLDTEVALRIFLTGCVGAGCYFVASYYGYCFVSIGAFLFGFQDSEEVQRWSNGAFVRAPAFLVVWTAVLYGFHCFKYVGFLAVMLYSGSLVAILYGLGCYYVFHVLPGVSVPGGPRPHKIQRHPAWEDKNWEVLEQSRQHRYVTAEESHVVSEQLFAGTCAVVSGEPSGRDMWTTETKKDPFINRKASKKVDESLVRTLASGGRSYSGFNPHLNPNSADRPYRAQAIREYLSQPGNSPPSQQPAKSPRDSARKAVHFYSMLQASDGHWPGDYGGPHFLLPGLIVVWYCMGQPRQMLGLSDVQLIIPYIVAHQQLDGGWGTHIESPSTMFGTTLMYVALRLLGRPPSDPVCVKGRAFIQKQGGAIMTSSWAKFYLCLLGVMHWDGHNSVPPEMWLLPNWFPFHPGRMWCHARMVYLPMGYLYGSRYVYDKAESDPTVLALRDELYCEPYPTIKWDSTRHMVAPMDNYSPIPNVMRIAQNCLACYENWPIFQPFKNFVRSFGLSFCVDYMAAEDLQTNFIDIGPVNKVLNMLSAYNHVEQDISHPTVVNHMLRVADYLWVAEDGMKMKGYNGSQCWDTSFAIQAISEAELLDEFPVVSKKVWGYLERCQILSTEVSQATPAHKYESGQYRRQYYRHLSEGGWPFSTSAHGWPISDCTGEGLKGVLCLLKCKSVQTAIKHGLLKPISAERLEKAADVLLSYQNEDGGFATYENCRGFGWYEWLNPSEVFGDIMIDYSYVECSMAALTGLVDFHECYPAYRSEDIRHAIARGRTFLHSLQRKDGSWYGSWACCFCYACWFGVEGLIKCGEPRESESISKACSFLLRHQRANGGWGEDFTSCYDKEYASEGMKAYGDDGSGVVNTAWALLALSAARSPNVEAVKRGVRYLMVRQLPCGDWPQEGIAGVFNRACGITYTAYRNVFPIWALGRCMAVYGESLES